METTVAAAAAIAAPRPYEIEPAVRVVESMERGDGERRAGRGEGRLEQDGVEGRLGALERSLERVAEAVGAKGSGPAAGDDDEDRRRLKEKLKEALDRERRVRTRKDRDGAGGAVRGCYCVTFSALETVVGRMQS